MVICQFCGAKNPVGASFCDDCGYALTSSIAAQASAQASAQAAQATAQHQAIRAAQQVQTANSVHGTGRLPSNTLLNKRYLVLKTVGQGGMAAVYQATDTRANRTVAIKEMSQDGLSPQELREALDNFSAEAKMLQSLSHDNLPKVYESFTQGSRHYLVMEYIDGQTLEQKLITARGPLPQADVLRWAQQLCAALDYLHNHRPPVIFRDLKPANIMVTAKGKIKLIDFGIARLFHDSRQKRDTQALGTPGYAPPEQYGSAQTDPRADIYALGATLYQLLTAYDVSKTPFALPAIQSRNPQVAPNVRHAIERATRLDRNQRYANIRDFQTDLLNPPGLYLLSGALAKSPDELLRLMAAQPLDGQDALYSGGAADWMTRWKRRDLADAATRAVRSHTMDRAAGLGAFLGMPTPVMRGAAAKPGTAGSAQWPSGTAASPKPGQRKQGQLAGVIATAVGAGVIAAVATSAKPKGAAQAGAPAKSPLQAGLSAAVTSIGASLVGTAALPAVSPRELDLGPVSAGATIKGILNISAQPGVNGVVKGLEPWITVSVGQFSGQNTSITVTAQATPGLRGQQRGAIQITVPGRSMFIPVIIDIVPSVQPVQPTAAPPPRATVVTPAAPGRSAQPAPARRANPTRVRPLVKPDNFGEAAIRLVISLALALTLVVSVPLLLFHGLGSMLSARVQLLPGWVNPDALIIILGALLAWGGAQLPYVGGRPAPGRMRTATLGALIGLIVALYSASAFDRAVTMSVGGNTIFPAASGLHQYAALAVAIPICVAIGAALGAQTLINRGLITIARWIGSSSWAGILVSIILGICLALTLGHLAIQPAPGSSWYWVENLVTPCGLVLGVIGGLMFSPLVGSTARNFATVRP